MKNCFSFRLVLVLAGMFSINIPFHALGKARDPEKLTYDFIGKEIVKESVDDVEKLKPGDFYKVIIKNINLNLYLVSFLKNDTCLSQKLNVPTWDLGMGGIKDMLDKLPLLNLISAAANQEKGISENKMEAIQPGQKQKPDACMALVGDFKNTLIEYNKTIESALSTLNTLLTSSKRIQLISMKESLTEDDKKILNKTDIDILYDKFQNVGNILNKVDINILQSYQTFMLNLNNLKCKSDSIPIRKKQYEELVEIICKTKLLVSADSVMKHINALVLLLNNSDGKYVSLPQQLTKDQTKLTITISPRSPNYNLQKYETEIVFPFHSKYFCGVSSGFFWGSGMNNKTYSVKQMINKTTVNDTTIKSDSSYKFVKENPGIYEFGVNSLVQFGIYLFEIPLVALSPCYFQLSFGPALAVSDKVRIRLQTGAGFSFGEKHLFSINVGANFGYCEKLSNSYDENGTYGTEPKNYMVSEIKQGWFLSVGYLFK